MTSLFEIVEEVNGYGRHRFFVQSDIIRYSKTFRTEEAARRFVVKEARKRYHRQRVITVDEATE